MEQAVVAKLKQLAEELFMLQQICHAQLWQRMESKKHWRQCVERLDRDIRESRTRIVELLNCSGIRKHIQSLGSHACGEFAKIHDLLPGYPLRILRWFSNEKHFNKWHLADDEQHWASGWKELSQLSEWLLLIAGAMNETPSVDSSQSDIDEVADTLTGQLHKLFIRMARHVPRPSKPGKYVSFDDIKAEGIVNSDDDEAVLKAIKRLKDKLVGTPYDLKQDTRRVRLERISPDK